jgi:hypothetical protein
MYPGSASFSEIHLTPEEVETVKRLREDAQRHPVRGGAKPNDIHRASLAGIDVGFFLWIDEDGESAQYRLQLMGPTGQPSLKQVQGFARLFFNTLDFQIIPDAFNEFRVQVMGLFFPLDSRDSFDR